MGAADRGRHGDGRLVFGAGLGFTLLAEFGTWGEPVQRPRPPVWIGCHWPHRRPLRRAARRDGMAPQVLGPDGS